MRSIRFSFYLFMFVAFDRLGILYHLIKPRTCIVMVLPCAVESKLVVQVKINLFLTQMQAIVCHLVPVFTEYNFWGNISDLHNLVSFFVFCLCVFVFSFVLFCFVSGSCAKVV